MTVKLLTEHYLEFLSLKGSGTGLSVSTLVKMPHCWKSHVTSQFIFYQVTVEAASDLALYRKSLDTPDEETVDTINWDDTPVFKPGITFTTISSALLK